MCAGALVLAFIGLNASLAAADPLKIAFWNMRSGKGSAALPGYAAPYTDSSNCTDPSLPLNAWGAGAVQAELRRVMSDTSIIALGVAESWISVCASPDRIRQALGWKSVTNEQNGVAVIARYGFAGPPQWQQLDTSTNYNPGDTMWVVRVPVCVDAGCTRSLPVYVAHWFGYSADEGAAFAKQAQQTVAFLKATANGEPHLLIGDLNIFEGGSLVCEQMPVNTALPYLRDAGYRDAWVATHGSAEGYTGMTNRAGCGNPVGYTWKRIDYAWTLPTLPPLDTQRFGVVSPGDASPSDHYGIVVSVANPFADGATTTTVPGSSGDGEIVLHARRATAIVGAWAPVSDLTAAGGVRLANADAGLPKLTTPLAAPISYFELPFTPKAGVAYRLWIRGKAQNDSYTNDSAYVQFSGSMAADGSPIYRIGSTGAAMYSLEESSGVGESGWGWQDTGYGLNVDGAPIYFDGTPQVIRVQAREDGLSIDQIVLSPVNYATVAPGQAKNDATILPESTGLAVASWTSLVNATASGATIQKVSGCGSCSDAGGVLLQTVAPGASVSFSVKAGTRLTAGLGTDTTSSTSYTGIRYGFSFSATGTWEIREAGIYRGEGVSTPGDVFKIAVGATAVQYYRNNVLVYTSLTAPPSGLIVDVSLETIGASVTIVR